MEDGIDDELRLLEVDHADLSFEGGGLGDQHEPGVWNLLSGAALQEQPSIEAITNESEGSAEEMNWYRQAQQDSGSLHSASVNRSSDHWSFVDSGSSSQPGRAPVSISSEGYQQALSSAFRAVPCRPQLALPWEAGLWGTIFGSKGPTDWTTSESFTLYRPVQPQALPLRGLQHIASGQDVELGEVSTLRIYMSVVSDSVDVPWQEQRALDFDRAIKLWLHTILRWDANCEIRQMVCEESSPEDQVRLLEDFFRGRAPSTLLKRARALARIANWLMESKCSGYPISEKLFYEFLRDERDKGAPASRLKGYQEAIVFSRFVLGVKGLEDASSSRRCLGATKVDLAKDRNQAPPLTVAQIQELHRKLHDREEDPWNRVFSGAVLCVLYARSRWGDAQHASRWAIDFDQHGSAAYLEIAVANHKTMRAAQHRYQFLPMVAIARGVVEREWVTTWFEVRDLLGIKSPPHHCVMPAPDREGLPLSRPLTSSEAGKWFRRLMSCECEAGDPKRITSHSFKASLLSMAAKRGYPLDDRLQMGYHATPGRMALVYSRDGAARSLRLLESMLSEIRRGQFLPDATRSGRLVSGATEIVSGQEFHSVDPAGDAPIPRAPSPPEPEVKSEIRSEAVGEAITVLESDAEEENALSKRADDSGHVTTGSSGSESSALTVPEVPRLTVPIEPAGFRFLQHKKTRMIHLIKDGNERVLECGRLVSDAHVRPSNVRFDSSVCSQCRKASGEAARA